MFFVQLFIGECVILCRHMRIWSCSVLTSLHDACCWLLVTFNSVFVIIMHKAIRTLWTLLWTSVLWLYLLVGMPRLVPVCSRWRTVETCVPEVHHQLFQKTDISVMFDWEFSMLSKLTMLFNSNSPKFNYLLNTDVALMKKFVWRCTK